jgi:YVTN family beta-propeller protein
MLTHTRIMTAAGLVLLLATGLLALVGAVPAAEAGDGPYALAGRWKIGGPGGWDYLTADPARARLFVTRGDHVDVLSLKDASVLGHIPGTSGVHGVALAPGLKRGFTSNGRANSVTEFDYETLAVLREVKIPGVNPDAIVFDEGSGRLFTFNGTSKDATVLDAKTLAVVATVAVPDKPEFATIDGSGRVYVNIESSTGQIVVIDAARAAVVATWNLPGCEEPTGIALDGARHRLFSVCSNRRMVVTDSRDGTRIAEVPIGGGPDAVAFDADRGLVFSSNGEGSLTVARADAGDRFSVLETLATARGARTMALDPVSHRVYLVTAEFGPTPTPVAGQRPARASPLPDTFTVLMAEPH